MSIRKNEAGQGVYIYAHNKSTDVPATGDAANITGSVARDGGARAALGNGVTEVDAVNMPGVYWQPFANAGETNGDAAGYAWVSSTANVVVEPLLVLTETITAKTSQLTFTNAGKVDAAILAAGDFVQAAADKVWTAAARTLTSYGTLVADVVAAVWVAATRTLTSFGTLVSDVVDGVWDETAADHVAAGSTGEKLSRLDAAVSTRATAGSVVSITSPVSAGGDLTIKQGDDYSLTDAAAIEFTYTNASYDPSAPTSLNLKLYAGTTVLATISGTVAGASPTFTLRFQPAAAATAALPAGKGYRYDIEVVKNARTRTLVEGTCEVKSN
jgi:hypothetical protein